jgi:hypothetical protein
MSTVTPVQATVPASLPYFLSELYDAGITTDQVVDALEKLIKQEIKDPDEEAKLLVLLASVKGDYNAILGTAAVKGAIAPPIVFMP